MDTNEFWRGSFGNEYHKRNRVDWRSRIPFWTDVVDRTGARSVHEAGCACGWNLSAIRRAYPDIKLSGHDINNEAVDQAFRAGLNVQSGVQSKFQLFYAQVELIFTAGVLIHISPDDIQEMMQNIIETSCDYVLAVEYESDHEEEILYRGHEGKLWKRDYGKLYQDLGLTLVDKWDAGSSFDKCTAWLLQK